MGNLRSVWPPVRANPGVDPDISTDETGGGRDDGYVFQHELLPQPDRQIQSNVTVKKAAETHRVVWKFDDDIQPESNEAKRLEKQGRGKGTGTGEFVRNLKLGDMVTVWAHARFPGWINYIDRVRIDMYWAV